MTEPDEIESVPVMLARMVACIVMLVFVVPVVLVVCYGVPAGLWVWDALCGRETQ